MKIRHGFVSNSSTTSFCIYGVYVDAFDFEDEGQEMPSLEYMANKLGLFSIEIPDGNDWYIGREWASIKDDETGRQFKEDTQKKIDQLPIKNKQCETFNEGWYDG